MEKTLLSQIAEIGSGAAIQRDGTGALAVMVGDVGASRFISGELTSVAKLPSSEEVALRDFDLLISLRGKHNGSSIFRQGCYVDQPVYASLDLAVIRARTEDRDVIQALWVWLNLASIQHSLGKFRMGSRALRLPLPALRELEVPQFTAARSALLHQAESAMREAKRIEEELTQRRGIMFESMLKQAAENCSVEAE